MPKAAESTIQDVEIIFIADFLADAASTFSDQSCNDFSVDMSPANLAVLLPVVQEKIAEYGAEWDAETDPASYLANSASAKDAYVLPNEWIAECLAVKYKKTPPTTIAAAEAAIIAALLEQAAELHAAWAENPEDEPDPFTLPPSAPYKAFMAALLLHRGQRAQSKKVLEATAPMSVPAFWAMQYLAHRCTTLAAGSAAIAVASSGQAPVLARQDGIPVIERPGIAPAFPDIKKYLKKDTVSFDNWQSKELRFLATYAAQGPDFNYRYFDFVDEDGERDDPNYRHDNVVRDLQHCAMVLRWHAIQVALGATLPKRSKSKGLEACIKSFEALRRRAPHIWNYSDDPETRDFKVAGHLLYAMAFTQAEVEQAMLACPCLHEILAESQIQNIPAAQRPAYAARVTHRAATDPAIVYYTQMRNAAEEELAAYRKDIGADWTIPWQRALAYHYWATRLGGSLRRGCGAQLDQMASTMVHCLLLGWEDWAWDSHRRCHALLKDDDFCDWRKKKPSFERRTQLFVLRLLDGWRGQEGASYPPQAHDEPLFDALLAHWRHPDPAALAPLLLAACDRHTQLSVAKGLSPDFGYTTYWYDPFEILLVLHLRDKLGLANPVLDHPLMQTPLGRLPAPAPRFQEDLLDSVVARFKQAYPEA